MSVDERQVQAAAAIERRHPWWVVIWGAYTRRLWAFPRFRAPGVIAVSAPDPQRLLDEMRQVEVEAGYAPAPAGKTRWLGAAGPQPAPPRSTAIEAGPVIAALPGPDGWQATGRRLSGPSPSGLPPAPGAPPQWQARWTYKAVRR
jgi:hypothetical protein